MKIGERGVNVNARMAQDVGAHDGVQRRVPERELVDRGGADRPAALRPRYVAGSFIDIHAHALKERKHASNVAQRRAGAAARVEQAAYRLRRCPLQRCSQVRAQTMKPPVAVFYRVEFCVFFGLHENG